MAGIFRLNNFLRCCLKCWKLIICRIWQFVTVNQVGGVYVLHLRALALNRLTTHVLKGKFTRLIYLEYFPANLVKQIKHTANRAYAKRIPLKQI